MVIIKWLSTEDKELLEKLDIQLTEKDYSNEECDMLCQYVYQNGFVNKDNIYCIAEKYYDLCNKIKALCEWNPTDEMLKITKEDYEFDELLETNFFHGAYRNSPQKINNMRKLNKKAELTQEEYKEYQDKAERFATKLSEFYKYVEKKYGDFELAGKFMKYKDN